MPDPKVTDLLHPGESLIPPLLYYHIPKRFLPLLYTLPNPQTPLPDNLDWKNNLEPSLVHIRLKNEGFWRFPSETDRRYVSHNPNGGTWTYESVQIPDQGQINFDALYRRRNELLNTFLEQAVGPKQQDIFVYRAPSTTEWENITKNGYYEVLEKTNFENERQFNSSNSQVKLYSTHTQAKNWDEAPYAGVIIRAKVDPRLYVDVPSLSPYVGNRFAHFLTSDQLEYSNDGGKTFMPINSHA